MSRPKSSLGRELALMKLPTPIHRDRIRELIPHAGSMCLLDRVVVYDDDAIECAAVSHRDSDNPLRHRGMLPVHTGIEYCAQAIAIHGQLTGGESGAPRRGYLAVIMNTEWTVERLDDCDGELNVFAVKQVALQQGVTYAFELKHQGHTLLKGQTVVALE
jgi:predicted hotdog family 3-hydroxylacyl-ACP dehydratase